MTRDPIDLLVDGLVRRHDERDARHHPRRRGRGARTASSSTSARPPTCARATRAARTIGGDRFVVTPGLVNTHIHITGEPLTRGYVPDDTPFDENVFEWLCPLYAAYDAAEERTSAQLAAVEMLRSGTTTFLEAGTIRFLDDVIDGLDEVGIRGRVGTLGVGPPARAVGLPPEHRRGRSPTCSASSTSTASHADGRIAAWSIARRPHDVQRSAVAGGQASWPTSTASG